MKTNTPALAERPADATPQRHSALAVMANRINVEPQKLLSTLKETVFKGANDNELLSLVVVANEYRLNPFLKEIYAFPGKGGGINPIVSIDGWIKILNRQDEFDGIDFSFEEGEDGKPISCTATVYVKDRSRPVKVTEFYAECYRGTEPWKQMPRRMLRHKALIQASRVAFGFSGIYDEDEARDIQGNDIRDVKIDKPKFTLPKKSEAVVDAEVVPNPDEELPPEPVLEDVPADSAQKTIAKQLADAGISERDFVAALKDYKISVQTINGLDDETAERVLFEFSDIVDDVKFALATKEAKK